MLLQYVHGLAGCGVMVWVLLLPHALAHSLILSTSIFLDFNSIACPPEWRLCGRSCLPDSEACYDFLQTTCAQFWISLPVDTVDGSEAGEDEVRSSRYFGGGD